MRACDQDPSRRVDVFPEQTSRATAAPWRHIPKNGPSRERWTGERQHGPGARTMQHLQGKISHWCRGIPARYRAETYRQMTGHACGPWMESHFLGVIWRNRAHGLGMPLGIPSPKALGYPCREKTVAPQPGVPWCRIRGRASRAPFATRIAEKASGTASPRNAKSPVG